jgi:sialate O-acetylesterase
MEIPKHWNGRAIRLSLGEIDDDDVTYFNGQKVGATRGWQAMRNYEVPGNWVSPGPSVLAIEVTDGAGPGGLRSSVEHLYAHPVDDPEDRISLAGPARMIVAAEVRNMPAQHKPAHLYNGMLYPLRDYGLAGAAWYQGENNAIGRGRAEEYEVLLPMLINDWRSLTNHEDLPFLIVQLPNWDHKGGDWNYPRLRETQRLTHERVPHTGLAITTDIGDAGDIHPRNKHDVGDRLARWALVDVYGRSGVVKSGPLPREVAWGPDGVLISFDTFGSPLSARGRKGNSGREVAGFELAGLDGSMVPVKGKIESDESILISYPESGGPWTMVRYAWKPDPTDAELCNAVGLPASPFEYPGSGLD